MAENVTPVILKVKDFENREVLMVDYKFNQATDREGQIAGIPRGGRLKVRVKAMNDGNSQLLQWQRPTRLHRHVPEHGRWLDDEGTERHRLLLRELQGELGGRPGALRGDRNRMSKARKRSRRFLQPLEVTKGIITVRVQKVAWLKRLCDLVCFKFR